MLILTKNYAVKTGQPQKSEKTNLQRIQLNIQAFGICINKKAQYLNLKAFNWFFFLFSKFLGYLIPRMVFAFRLS